MIPDTSISAGGGAPVCCATTLTASPAIPGRPAGDLWLGRGQLVTGAPKSQASKRTVSIPAFLLPAVVSHLDEFTAQGDDSLVFTGPKGAPLRRSNFTRAWRQATGVATLADVHFHDLRHTGNTMAGEAGASLRELMDRMGHSSMRAALIYQHRTAHRDKMIAAAISERVSSELGEADPPRARSGHDTRSGSS